MTKMLLLGTLIAALVACRDDVPQPTWLQALQATIASAPVTNPPSRIYQYRYRDQTVYYRPPYCCDIQGVLYSADGAVMCYPDGGFTGRGDGRCNDFHAQRSDCALLWSDPRGKARGDDGCKSAGPSASSER